MDRALTSGLARLQALPSRFGTWSEWSVALPGRLVFDPFTGREVATAGQGAREGLTGRARQRP